MRLWSQLYLQDPLSLKIFILSSFHDLILIIITLVLRIISYIIIFIITNNLSNRKLIEAHKTELIWTIVPGIILLIIAIPSLKLLYLIDELNEPILTIKIIGHQWYWRYEYSDFPYISYDSFIVPENILNLGEFRLLEVDNRLIIPINTEVRLLVSSSDVIHAWTIPVLGIKVDAIPGRLNQLGLTTNRAGVFYGQCSEICGANHSFMPIALESIKIDSFINWKTTIK